MRRMNGQAGGRRRWRGALVLAVALSPALGRAQQPAPPREIPPPVAIAPPGAIAPPADIAQPQRLPAPELDSPAVPRALQPLVQNIESIPAPAGPTQLIDFEQTALANHPQLAAAWQAVQAAEAMRPDVVLLDLGMPKLNGYDACRRIRQQPWGKQMFLVALTGWGQEDDVRRTEEAGFDRHVVKPVDPAVLHTLLSSLVAARRSQPAKR